MNPRKKYLKDLRVELKNLGSQDIDGIITYVNEIIDDQIETGLSEEEAVWNLPHPDKAAREFNDSFSNNETKTSKKEDKTESKKKRHGRHPALIILTFPLWFTLIMLYVSIIITFWSLVVTVIVLPIAFVAGSVFTGVFTPASFMAGPQFGLFSIGAIFALIALAIFSILLIKVMIKGSVGVSKSLPVLIRWVFTTEGAE